MTDAIPFGAWVEVSANLMRVRDWKYSARIGQSTTVKVWREYEVPPTAAIYLGTRTLRNGALLWQSEGGAIFEPEGPVVRAALVCVGPRSKPYYVPLDAVSLPATVTP